MSNDLRVHKVKLPLGNTGHNLGMSWAVGNRMVVFTSTLGHDTGTNQRRTMSSGSPELCHLTWETTLYNPIFRKLVNESSQAFFDLQKLAREEKVLSNASLVKVSRKYRSIIRDCQEEVDRWKSSSGGGAQDMEDQSGVLYKLELIWNLVELLLIEKHTGGIILPSLLQWISYHFGADKKFQNILADLPEKPETHPDFWDALTLSLAQGRKEDAQKWLRLHSRFAGNYSASSNSNDDNNSIGDVSSDTLASLDELIRKMPTFNPSMSVVDFNFRWKHWRENVIARIDEGDFLSNKHLNFISLLLAGSDEALTELAKKCETWYQFLVAKLLFTSPDIKSYDLALQAERAINKFGGLSNMNSLDSIILATMEGDVAQLMNELTTSLDNFWFPAHLLDLLHHGDQLDTTSDNRPLDSNAIQPGPGLREFLLLEYGSCLMTHTSLWQLGALYLDHCPTQGTLRLECFLERMDLQSAKKANKVICLASKRGMTSVVSGICKVMGMKALKAGQMGTAMSWALRSQNVQFTTFLADNLLKRYAEEGAFTSANLIDNLGSSMIVSDRLTFLAKYREFHKLCEESEFQSAAKMLHSLMWSRMAPKYFWVTLLIDAIPFLSMESNEVLFSSEQTYEIMHCLQELMKDSSLNKKQRMLLEEHEPQIRMNLSQNLAMALMEEGEAK